MRSELPRRLRINGETTMTETCSYRNLLTAYASVDSAKMEFCYLSLVLVKHSIVPIREASFRTTYHEELTCPSTFYQNNKQWPMMDSADPLDGWDLRHVLDNFQGSAANDIYGKLFNLLKDLLTSFARQVASRKMVFELFNTDVNDLPAQLHSRRFARIEVIIAEIYQRP